jgi:hypothetical protein
MALQAHRAKSLAQKAAEHPYTVNPGAHVPALSGLTLLARIIHS